MSSPGHYIPVFLLLNIFFLISGGCAVSPFNDWEEEGESPSEETLSMSKRATNAYTTTEEDRPRILCGQALIHTLKEQCGQRGTFSPYQKRAVRELIRVARGLPSKFPPPLSSYYLNLLDISDFVDAPIHLRKRYDDICEVYLRYEPESPLSQCCCLGCTRAYLENFCAEA
uniref:Putative insulin-like protein n=1 Tax=Taenia solium TaxID=6204 RepID=V5NC99_TAESO|nr:putative insulin-like protein [Taenia solium]